MLDEHLSLYIVVRLTVIWGKEFPEREKRSNEIYLF